MTQPFLEYEKKERFKKKKMPAASHPRIPFILRCLSVKGDSCDKRGDKCAGANVQTPQPGTVGLVMLLRVVTTPSCKDRAGRQNGSRGNDTGFASASGFYISQTEHRVNKSPFQFGTCALVSLFLIFLYSNSFSLRF